MVHQGSALTPRLFLTLNLTPSPMPGPHPDPNPSLKPEPVRMTGRGGGCRGWTSLRAP